MTTIDKLAAIRQLMQKENLAAYIIPGNDPHASEYMAPYWQEMQWMSGFQGESGTLVVTLDKALLWTDSRYYLQATTELAGSTIELMRESDVDCPSISDWLCQHVQGVVGVNPEMYSVRDYTDLRLDLGNGGLELRSIDLIAPLWTNDRPALPASPVMVYDEQYAGETTTDKLIRVRRVLEERRADAMVISALDEIGWLLNIRGKDIEYTPCVIAYVVVEKQRCTLFVENAKLGTEARAYFQRMNVTVAPYDAVFDYLKNLSAKAVLLDSSRVNEALCESIAPEAKRMMLTPCPVQVMMSTKNQTELAGERIAMREDAVALVRFFLWLDTYMQNPDHAVLDEVDIADRLHAFRAKGKNFMDESFATIAGWKANGAIVHYHAVKGACAKIEGDGVLLLDSGGQYLDGTTDITRTVWIGNESNIPNRLKHDFTLVLKGHIALARARFPKGTRGNQLDILAHQFMWQEGITFGHGTGHGVGHYMGCHEGPSNIRTDNNPNPIRLGQVFSDEPGIYRTGEYGIRTENLITAVPAPKTEHTTGEEYYQFEVLTLCPYDTRLIDLSMLTDDEKTWINDYHKHVYQEIAPMLTDDEQLYLKQKTKTI